MMVVFAFRRLSRAIIALRPSVPTAYLVALAALQACPYTPCEAPFMSGYPAMFEASSIQSTQMKARMIGLTSAHFRPLSND